MFAFRPKAVVVAVPRARPQVAQRCRAQPRQKRHVGARSCAQVLIHAVAAGFWPGALRTCPKGGCLKARQESFPSLTVDKSRNQIELLLEV
jgi:hypothetical protein